MALTLKEPPSWMRRHALLVAMRLLFLFTALGSSGASLPEIRQLKVGEELTWEKLPLRNGKCIYELKGLHISRHYEVKISYPASIPAIFSLTLVDDPPANSYSAGRKLLNTEKIVFPTTAASGRFKQNPDDSWKGAVLVTVEPEGYVAMRHVEDQEVIVYNILCEEVVFGLPTQAWWMAFLVILAMSVTLLVSPRLFKVLVVDTVKAKTR